MSKQNKRNNFFKLVKSWWHNREEKLDENPRRTGIWMAVILTVAFLVFAGRTVIYFTSPKPTTPVIYQPVQRPDTVVKDKVSGSLNEYLRLLQIQDELEKMQADPANIDTARINELYNKLLK
jgi:hypothetical protein